MVPAFRSPRAASPAAGRALILSCEHGGREVPPDHAALFAGLDALLETHRGWDPGALVLAREMARSLDAPLFAATTTRLLVDLNRSIGHRQLFSAEASRGLSRARRREIIARHYRPHRDAVEGEIARRIAAGEPVLHVASHSFTPQLNGVVRDADVGWLYDPRRPAEVSLARGWMGALARRAPDLRLRRNYPYRGRGDGLASLLRQRHDDAHYAGIELEVNQRFVHEGRARWRRLRRELIESLAELLSMRPGRDRDGS